MAEVYKARVLEGPRAGQMVAVKRLTPRLATDPEAVDLFCGEADVSAMLKHPNIVEVFEAGGGGGKLYPTHGERGGGGPGGVLCPRPGGGGFPPGQLPG